jgi:hypothetical protein
MDDVIIFQKLTNQEMVILSALDHLDDDSKTDDLALNKNKNKNENKNVEEEDDDVSDISDDSDNEEDN